MSHLLGIDIGTSATKALILSHSGKVVATASQPHELLSPKPGWFEQDPQGWWLAACQAVKAAMRKAKLKKEDIEAIGLSGQMHGSVFLDEKGRIVRHALLWNDQRTADQSKAIIEAAGGEKKILKMTGNLPLTGYTAPKILWLKENEGKKWARVSNVVLPKDYIRFRLTGDFATDVGDASGTALFDVKKRKWSSELIELLKLDEALFPQVYESTEVTGVLHSEAAAAMELNEGTPVVAGSGDVMTGAIGNGITEAGLVNAALGTSGVMCAFSDKPAIDKEGRLATMCHAVPGKYVVFGCMLSAAGSLQWYADQLGEKTVGKKGDVFGKLMKLAEKSPAGANGTLFMPYLTGERCPHNDPDARGGWIGVTRRTEEADLVRSLVEGVTFGMNDMLRIMRDELELPVKQIRATGGGSQSTLWRQMQADVYGTPIALMSSEEGAAYGAALLAGVGSGAFKSIDAACKSKIKPKSTIKPKAKDADCYAKQYDIYTKLYGNLHERFDELATAYAG